MQAPDISLFKLGQNNDLFVGNKSKRTITLYNQSTGVKRLELPGSFCLECRCNV
jgi:hypothetical protein